MSNIILPLLLILNLAVFITYGIDKSRAQRQQWRISDKTLLALAVVAGFGAFAGMQVFHHKTHQTVFKLAAIIGIVINSAVLAWGVGYCILLGI